MADDETKLQSELTSLLTDVQRFLMQEQDLFGNILYPESKSGQPKKSAQPIHAEEALLFPNIRYPDEPWTVAPSLDGLNQQICTCVKCPLGATRTNFVFGVGNSQAKVVVIGEAPGADEDAQGEPFVGRAGQLLNKILEAIKFKREEVFICNILKCRPPNNRDPLPEEVEQCEPYLWKQLELIRPIMILAVGRIAGQTLLKTTRGLGELRGTIHSYHGIPMMVTYHPAALLRNPNWKRPTWEDVQQFRKLYDESINGANQSHG
ncbi:MAG: uracil-DNA glycosylase [Bacteroidota bacterium]